MIETINPLVGGAIIRAAKVTANQPASYAAYVDLSNMQSGDEVAFWIEYDVGDQDNPVPAGTVETISYDDIAQTFDPGGPNEETLINAGWALEPVMLEAGQVSQVALAQTAGTPKAFTIRNTNQLSGQ